MNTIVMRWTARALLLLWACFWTYFALASTLDEGFGWLKVLGATLLVALTFFSSALIPWRWEAPGSVLLAVEGLLFCAAYPLGFFPVRAISTTIFVLLTLAAPPLVSAFLFFMSWRRSLTPGAA